MSKLKKNCFICMRIKNHFLISGFALTLALKQRLGATRKWSIRIVTTQDYSYIIFNNIIGTLIGK